MTFGISPNALTRQTFLQISLRFYYEHRSEVSGKQRNQKTTTLTHPRLYPVWQQQGFFPGTSACSSFHQQRTKIWWFAPVAWWSVKQKKRAASYWNISNWKCQGPKSTIMPFCSWKYFSINFTMFIITVWFIIISIYTYTLCIQTLRFLEYSVVD